MRSFVTAVGSVCFVLALAPATLAEVIRLSEPVAQTADSETFAGAPFSFPDTRALTLSELVSDAEALAGSAVLVETRIARVCQKKGCFFIAQEGAHSMRVAFKDYGFFVPTDSAGKKVTLFGELVARELSDAEAAHFSADLGGARVPAGRSYEIVATAVRVPK